LPGSPSAAVSVMLSFVHDVTFTFLLLRRRHHNDNNNESIGSMEEIDGLIKVGLGPTPSLHTRLDGSCSSPFHVHHHGRETIEN
jgi:hypothetical protein